MWCKLLKWQPRPLVKVSVGGILLGMTSFSSRNWSPNTDSSTRQIIAGSPVSWMTFSYILLSIGSHGPSSLPVANPCQAWLSMIISYEVTTKSRLWREPVGSGGSSRRVGSELHQVSEDDRSHAWISRRPREGNWSTWVDSMREPPRPCLFSEVFRWIGMRDTEAANELISLLVTPVLSDSRRVRWLYQRINFPEAKARAF